MTFDIPVDALVTNESPIRVLGLRPGARTTLQLDATDGAGLAWSASAEFVADSSGVIDTSVLAPVAGAYSGVEPLGLFWSMTSAVDAPFTLKVDRPVPYELTVDGRVYSFTRRALADGVSCERISSHGLRGELYLPKGAPRAGAIVLSGSGGGIVATQAAVLAAQGYAALALGYFRYEDLPKDLRRIPLEYFQRAVEFLRDRARLGAKPVALVGGSRGGELVLLLGTKLSGLAGIVARTPSSVVYGGFGEEEINPEVSAWTVDGTDLPFAPYDYEQEKCVVAAGDMKAIRDVFLSSRSQWPTEYAAAAIPVERITCPVLMLCGRDDRLWPADVYADEIEARAKAHGAAERFTIHRFPEAGHSIGFPMTPPAASILHPVDGLRYVFGGTSRGNAHAASKAWREILRFMDGLVRRSP